MFDASRFGTLICYGLLGSDEVIFLPLSSSLGMFRFEAIHGFAIFAHYRDMTLNFYTLTFLLVSKKASFRLRF